LADVVICNALFVLALNSYHEARSEPIQGQVAVAQVVLRRAGFNPRRVCKVVYKPSQFSWTAAHPPVRDRAAWVRAARAAQIAMLWGLGAPSPDYSAGATHYHTAAVCPRWSAGMVRVVVIGEHEFYRRML
jgi:spore germination cell wall hydrolase CwlJ-like protein